MADHFQNKTSIPPFLVTVLCLLLYNVLDASVGSTFVAFGPNSDLSNTFHKQKQERKKKRKGYKQ